MTQKFLYKKLRGMIERCYDSKHPSYPNYGGRLDENGNPDPVKVHEPWRKNFRIFIDYCNSGQMPKTLAQFKLDNPGKVVTVDRIDNDKDYEPLNIQWATQQKQMQNYSGNVLDEEMVRVIKIELQIGNMRQVDIIKLLKIKYNYNGSRTAVYNIIYNKTWTDIIITPEEIAKYKQFTIINNI